LEEVDIKHNPDENLVAQRRSDVFGSGLFAAGMTLLLWAVDVSNKEICELLLKYYPTLLDHPDLEGSTPLHYASLNGDLGLAQYLLDKDAQIKEDNYGETALHCAALNGHSEVCKLLLSKGANPNKKGQTGSTALHHAVVNKQLKVITVLLNDPAVDYNIKDGQGRTARMLASEGGNKDVMDYFESEKREKLEKISELSSSLSEHKQAIAKYEERRDADQRSISVAYKRLKDEEDEHKKTKEKLANLMEVVKVRTLTEHEERYQDLKDKYNLLVTKSDQLEKKLEELQNKKEDDVQTIDTKVVAAHRSLSSLLVLLDTTSLAIVSAKNEVEAVRSFMQLPQDEQK